MLPFCITIGKTLSRLVLVDKLDYTEIKLTQNYYNLTPDLFLCHGRKG